MPADILYGIHAVSEALRSRGRSFEYVAFSRDRKDGRLQKLIDQCRQAKVPVRFLGSEDLARLIKFEVKAESGSRAAHQGVVAVAAAKTYCDLEELLALRRGAHAFILALDGVEDPHNLGAIVRTADAAGVDGIVIPERRAVGVTATVAKASAGASEHVPIARVTNLGRAVDELKSRNIWTVGLDERGSQLYDHIDYAMDCAILVGAEGHGLHDQIRKKCDHLVSIPMLGKVASLNASVAAAVVMYEVARQRRKAAAAGLEPLTP